MHRPGVSSFALVACALVAGCSSDPSPAPAPNQDAGTDTAVTGPMSLKVDTWNVGLAGSFVPEEAARRPKVIEALAAHDADVVCLQEVWFDADKTAIAAAVAAKYPHSASFATDLGTPIDDPRDLEGNTIAKPTTAPCADPTMKSGLDAAVDCLQASCNSTPGSASGKTTSATCASDSCAASVVTLLGAEDQRCYGCLVANIPASTFADIRSECGTNPNGGLGFGGRNGVMILSKYPLTEPAKHVLPGTWSQRVIGRATVNLPNGATVDVHCNHFTAIFRDGLYPYTGQYGLGKKDAEGWANEQLVQAKQQIAFQKTRPEARAILLGDFNTSRKEGDVDESALPTLETFEAEYVPGVAPGYVPACTYCKSNPLTDGTESSWLDRIVLAGIPKTAIQSSQRIFTDPVVDGRVPLSDHYGYRVVVEIAP